MGNFVEDEDFEENDFQYDTPEEGLMEPAARSGSFNFVEDEDFEENGFQYDTPEEGLMEPAARSGSSNFVEDEDFEENDFQYDTPEEETMVSEDLFVEYMPDDFLVPVDKKTDGKD